MLISFSGIDCAGKSTQIHLLREAICLRSQRRCRVFWFRPGYSREMDFFRKVLRLILPGALPTKEQKVSRDAMFARPAVSTAWVMMALLDSMFQYAIKLRFLRLFGSVVICDRYVTDAALDFELRFPNMQVRSWALFRLLVRIVPRPEKAFLLVLSKEEMVRRMAIKQEPFPDTPEVRDFRYERYRSLADAGLFTVIDASDTVDRVHEAIMKEIAQI